MNNMRSMTAVVCIHEREKFKYEKIRIAIKTCTLYFEWIVCMYIWLIISPRRSKCEKKEHLDGYNITVFTIAICT